MLFFFVHSHIFPVQVAIPVVSVRLVKKHKTAGLVPNGLAITTDTGQKVKNTVCQFRPRKGGRDANQQLRTNRIYQVHVTFKGRREQMIEK